jgi:Xaa-Pro aminopeptidase
MGAALKANGVAALLVTSPASLAWLFNIRGGDVAHTPLPLGRALLMADGRARLFLHPDKCGPELKAHLGSEVRLDSPEALSAALRDLRGGRIGLDPANAPAALFDAAREAGCELVTLTDPSALARACKNDAEIAGVAAAHERDGVAVTRFLHWLATDGQSGKVTEIEAVETLEAFRQADAALKDLSFETISGAGPNGAIIHYRVSTATNRPLQRGSLFLVDSGGQYADGTTDVTRTVAIGRPSREMRERYTLVLKGHIALSTVRFPEGTTGTHLDILARHALWQAGLDYAHGTGHGVGAYLGVHEGPQRISKALNPWALQPGMIVSNEPGYYKENAYGIRIENLQYVTKAEPIEGGEIPMLGFATLTLAPLERALILRRMLTRAELIWVDAYHQRVRDTLSPRLDPVVRAWLDQVCSPL